MSWYAVQFVAMPPFGMHRKVRRFRGLVGVILIVLSAASHAGFLDDLL